ncbi:MAG: serine/threonine kinase [Labilithrix sp.]|nr:serine/threonine kinase [Labilithrix sp.]
MRCTILAAAVAACACGPTTKDVPPVGEVIVVIDTDMPVPAFISRLRIDLYTTDGRWYESRDLSRSKATDWPTSFGVYLADPAKEQTTIVRLRAYAEGEVRDYRGERYATRPDAAAPPFALAEIGSATDEPRLLRDDGSDVTPATEPAPLLTIDRLLRVRVVPEVRGAVRVLLHGVCVGTMADVAGGASCVDQENTLVPSIDEPTIADTTLPAVSAMGTFAPATPCTAMPRRAGNAADGSPLFDEEACVDGKMFILGTNRAFGLATRNDVPRRVAILPSFRIDRYEVTVGRWRDALAHGFEPQAEPVANEGVVPKESSNPTDNALCTWSAAPRGREDYALNCVDHASARAFCTFLGGDLPTEAQWEFVAATAGREHPTPFPWGGDANAVIPCERAAVGRGPFPFDNQCNPDAKHFGPLAVSALAGPEGDISLGLGVVNLIGNVVEATRDTFASFASNCWARQPLDSPGCLVKGTDIAGRGGSWYSSAAFVGTRLPLPGNANGNQIGFRCVRSGG